MISIEAGNRRICSSNKDIADFSSDLSLVNIDQVRWNYLEWYTELKISESLSSYPNDEKNRTTYFYQIMNFLDIALNATLVR